MSNIEEHVESNHSATGNIGAGDMVEYARSDIMQAKFEVGFDPAIQEIIAEVKYLERLGFDVPVMAKNIAMLEDVYALNVCALNQMLQGYYSTVALLDDIQVEIVPVINLLKSPA